jgi:methyl-accepting chemotaxis protein
MLRMELKDLFGWFHKLRIYGKLFVSFLFTALLTAATGVTGIIYLSAQGGFASTASLSVAAVAFISIVLELLLGRYIAASIGLPIRLSVKVATMLSVGDLDVAEVVKDDHNDERADEYGELGQAFNALITNTQRQVDTAQKLADGDLTVAFDIRSDKDLLGKALTHVVENLNKLTASIASASNQVADSAMTLSTSSSELSQGATEQASAIQQLTASVEQVSSQIGASAKNAEKANELVIKANSLAEEATGR